MVMIFLIWKKNYQFNHSLKRSCSSYPYSINFYDRSSVIHGWLCFWSLFSIPLVILSTLWTVQYVFYLFIFFYILKIVLGIFDLLHFNINFRINMWIFTCTQNFEVFKNLAKNWQLYIIKSSEYENGIYLCS